MPVGNSKKRIYYSVSKDTAKIKTKNGDNVLEYDYLEGRLKSVQYQPAENINGTKIGARFVFIFSDGLQEEVFQAGVGASYIHFILGALDANEAIKNSIKLSPYLRTIVNKSTNESRVGIAMSVWNNNKMLRYGDDFYNSLAEIKQINVSGELHFDKTDRINQIRTIAEKVNAKYTMAWSQSEKGISNQTSSVDQERFDDDDDTEFAVTVASNASTNEDDDLPF